MHDILNIDWTNFFLGKEDLSFLLMIVLRTCSMFFIILLGLRLLGKSGVSQLSVFELGIIVGLGSAAGDPMFYQQVGILSAILVFTIIVGLYHFLKYILGKNQKLDQWVEGEPKNLVVDGKLVIKRLAKEPLTRGELFAQLRSSNVSQLGQIKQAILEQSGTVNVFYFSDEEVKWGLPILPQFLKDCMESIPEKGDYSCLNCSFTDTMEPEEKKVCPVCGKMSWVKASGEKRIT